MPPRPQPQRRPPPAPSAQSVNLRMAGMHGLGDNLHQRGVVRQLMQRHVVWLETSWPCLYHDLVGPRLHLVGKTSPVPVYARNATREAAGFTPLSVPADAWPLKVFYTPTQVRSAGSVLAAMCSETGTDVALADFRLPIPPEWDQRAQALLDHWGVAASSGKPLMIYRPLVERGWWGGCVARNPDHAAYAELMRSIRARFFVVSVADLRPGEEWMVGEPIDADVTLHAGELEIETLAALTARAALVYTSPGFAVILAQAVGTPSVVVFGGYENSSSFSAGARFAPYLGIDTLTPCDCFSHHHGCEKRIDMASAIKRISRFSDAAEEDDKSVVERPATSGEHCQ